MTALADTLGEMPGLLAGAALVFVGGSLIPRGGQNPLEPAAAGRAVVCGPHMENFATELAELRAAEALVQVADETELARVLGELMAKPERVESLGRNGAALVESRQGVVADYLARLERLGLV